MKKLFEALIKPSRLILIIGGFAYAGLYSIIAFAGIGGGFLSVMAHLIITILTLAAVVAAPILLLLKKEEAAKLCFVLVAGYWLVSSTQNYLFFGDWAGEGGDGLVVAAGIFGFLAGLALAGVLVLLILNFILKKDILKFVALLAFVTAYLFIFIFIVLEFVMFIKYESPWTNYINMIIELVAPVAILFGYLYFLGAPNVEFAKKQPKEEEPKPVEEPAPEEAPQEEKPE